MLILWNHAEAVVFIRGKVEDYVEGSNERTRRVTSQGDC